MGLLINSKVLHKEWLEVSEKILREANYCCRLCGTKDKAIKAYLCRLDLRTIRGAAALCRDCYLTYTEQIEKLRLETLKAANHCCQLCNNPETDYSVQLDIFLVKPSPEEDEKYLALCEECYMRKADRADVLEK